MISFQFLNLFGFEFFYNTSDKVLELIYWSLKASGKLLKSKAESVYWSYSFTILPESFTPFFDVNTYIGLTPYVPTASILHPKLNALYCAPNKIYEYSAFGVPMLGTDVIGLLRPFEQYRIGKCIKNMDSKSILDGIEYIDSNHEEMSQNAKEFFEKDNLDKIVLDILK